jgi:hypothetical protein
MLFLILAGSEMFEGEEGELFHLASHPEGEEN